jgi:fructosamine-3-kinase
VRAAADAALRLLGRPVADVRRLAGGDLSQVFRLVFQDGAPIIAKHGATAVAEAAMLRSISASGAPAPVVHAAEGEWLLMEEIAHDGAVHAAWPDLARALGLLHAVRESRYGWFADHAFGRVRIENGWAETWPSFWAERRLRCHLPYLPMDLARRIERLADRIEILLPGRPDAALLHGDLWGGNILVAQGRVRALIDPACYYGDREADLAMLSLFDRPPPSFFESLALAAGWRERQPIYRLWPLLVHLRLFGRPYAEPTAGALEEAGF